jgi:FAD/FMN-containing dehydrogenase
MHDGIFDLPKLFTGSEGTLCLIDRIKFRTIARPQFRRLVIINIQELGELDAVVSSFRNERPSALELLDKSIFTRTGKEAVLRKFGGGMTGYMLFCEIEGGREQEVEDSMTAIASESRISQFDPAIISDSGQMSEAWEVRNMTLSIAGEMRKGTRLLVPGVEDVTVPQSKLGELLGFMQDTFEGNGLDYISYGHAGDANLHMRPLLDPKKSSDLKLLKDLMESVFAKVWKLGGTITGEHGDGMLRAPFVKAQYPETYEIMVEVKKAYDPKGLLNPMVKIQVKK